MLFVHLGLTDCIHFANQCLKCYLPHRKRQLYPSKVEHWQGFLTKLQGFGEIIECAGNEQRIKLTI